MYDHVLIVTLVDYPSITLEEELEIKTTDCSLIWEGNYWEENNDAALYMEYRIDQTPIVS